MGGQRPFWGPYFFKKGADFSRIFCTNFRASVCGPFMALDRRLFLFSKRAPTLNNTISFRNVKRQSLIFKALALFAFREEDQHETGTSHSYSFFANSLVADRGRTAHTDSHAGMYPLGKMRGLSVPGPRLSLLGTGRSVPADDHGAEKSEGGTSQMIKAVLSNTKHPEYGLVAIPSAIPTSEYVIKDLINQIFCCQQITFRAAGPYYGPTDDIGGM
jgi:hypothetical protein